MLNSKLCSENLGSYGLLEISAGRGPYFAVCPLKINHQSLCYWKLGKGSLGFKKNVWGFCIFSTYFIWHSFCMMFGSWNTTYTIPRNNFWRKLIILFPTAMLNMQRLLLNLLFRSSFFSSHFTILTFNEVISPLSSLVSIGNEL